MNSYDWKVLSKALDRCTRDMSTNCLIWTGPIWGGSTCKYPVISYKGKGISGHRLVYQLCSGVVITSKQPVLHACDNPLCMEYGHLSEGTQKRNCQEMTARGRSSSQLTPDNVREMRRRYAEEGMSKQQIANEYGVEYNTAVYIINRRTWKMLV